MDQEVQSNAITRKYMDRAEKRFLFNEISQFAVAVARMTLNLLGMAV